MWNRCEACVTSKSDESCQPVYLSSGVMRRLMIGRVQGIPGHRKVGDWGVGEDEMCE